MGRYWQQVAWRQISTSDTQLALLCSSTCHYSRQQPPPLIAALPKRRAGGLAFPARDFSHLVLRGILRSSVLVYTAMLWHATSRSLQSVCRMRIQSADCQVSIATRKRPILITCHARIFAWHVDSPACGLFIMSPARSPPKRDRAMRAHASD